MKICQVVDTYQWAIGTLAKAIVRYNLHFHWTQHEVHPKDLEAGRLDWQPVAQAIREADIVDIQYWRTASLLLDRIPELSEKPVILTHHNEKNLLSHPWPKNFIHVAKTRYSEQVLKEAYPEAEVRYIPNSFDHHRFQFQQSFPPAEKAVGYVGRICAWKGLKELAKACRELGYPLYVMGKYDKMDYFNSIPQEDRDNIRWDFFNCEPEDQLEIYKNITCYVGNSGSGREVGTLGFIEALAMGVPVVTTPAGLAADIGEDKENMLLVDYGDQDGLREAIAAVMESPALQHRLRRAGWNTIRGYTDRRMAWQYRQLLNDTHYQKPLVSVVIPTTPERIVETGEILAALAAQTYPAVEAVVVVDQCPDLPSVPEFPLSPIPVKVLATGDLGGYNLAKARNLGVIEADGEYVMLCDSRMKPEPDAVEKLVEALERSPDEKAWVFGEKGGDKKTFVENFSLIRRQHLIDGGMMNERIDAYGGMSQELRTRFGRQGFSFGYVPTARATQLCDSKLTAEKRRGIVDMKDLLWKLRMK